ncbi:hypothetical protein HU200_049955 [Digitaria exilis]|uniref:BUB1 N-terminal domain-containing protein n=1 Tax=Digitaria exilis TaxID=1010633 RepID=A0A835AY01_9POAL|nr:hypothetical protein HU200_049955 [Digitaria exilis]
MAGGPYPSHGPSPRLVGNQNQSGAMAAAAAAGAEQEKELLSSVVSDIRCYSGSDPLRPWLRGMRKMERALPPATLHEKLPRFLQKCAQEFQDDARYRDDPCYLRVWIQLVSCPLTLRLLQSAVSTPFFFPFTTCL